MLGIHIAAIIAAVLALGGMGTIIALLTRGRGLPLMAILVLAELPLCWLGVSYIRPEIDGALGALSVDPGVLQFLRILYAPLTEEPLKLLPLIVPLVFRRIDAGNGIAAGLALGLGFGVGEAGYLASVVAKVPQYASLGPQMFGGFIVERLLVCFLHGAMTATVIWLWLRGMRWGIFVAMAVHIALNFPIYLMAQGTFGLGRPVWMQIAFAWMVAITIALAFWVVWMIRKPSRASGQPAG